MQKLFSLSITASLLAVSLLATSTGAAAATTLLSAKEQAQLSAWLGEGNLALTNIYTKAAGHTAKNFHAAVDGKGRTFSLMQATDSNGQTWLVGGYNPQSWSSAGKYNVTENQVDRTAFLFNLTSGKLHRQTPKANGLDAVGAYQTYNDSKYGPTFGWGHDLYVPDDLTHGGYSLMYSYINPYAPDTSTSLLNGAPFDGYNVTFGAMEVYSVAAVVPEPATYGMLLLGMGVLGVCARRRNRA
ncbi:PEP_CTERM-anchored TLD domain-containing protein [Massilia sp. MB5]|uniref:PEP_CTERM-anchored TLD domain-containing protein n=1 Tax=Massilia sp. MB5 TaxID=2919578 RepID=UPI001F1059E4|nr:PEP_CTERM-anchored TLD domain-containing protein [Massilia sp. MB5]UMR33221.1 PEP_CTERM-anchored TLD domain-containing protein [Massilia sp. MB5]